MAIGDSKTRGETCCVSVGGYRDELVSNLTSLGTFTSVGFVGSIATGGLTTAGAAAAIDSFLSGAFFDPHFVLVNLGSNDFPLIHAGTLNQSQWESSMGYVLDAIHARFPSAQVLLMRPVWYTYETEFDAYNDTWIPSVLASRSAWAAVGPDERTFLSFPFNMTDYTHPDSTGYSTTAAEWQTAMGYQADVFVALTELGGDGVLDPALGSLQLYFKQGDGMANEISVSAALNWKEIR